MRLHLLTTRKASWLCSIMICLSFLGLASMSETFGFRAEASGSAQLSSGFYAPLDNFDPNGYGSGQGFGPRSVSGGSSWHSAIDYGRSSGSSIYPIYTGEVVRKDYSAGSSTAYGSGYSITIKHTIGSRTIYSHYQHMLSASSCQIGQTVYPNNVIGQVGHTGDANMSSKMGSHLDIRIFEGGTNPWALLNSSQVISTEGSYLSAYTTSGITYYNPAKVLDGTIRFIDPDPATALQFKNVTCPSTWVIKSAGWDLSSGTLVSDADLTAIRSEIIRKSDGYVVSDSGFKSISGHSYSLKTLDDYSGTNNGVRFSYIYSQGLGAGTYIWRLTGQDSAGRTIVLSMPFNAVYSGSDSNGTVEFIGPRKPSLSVAASDNMHETAINWGVTADTTYYDLRVWNSNGTLEYSKQNFSSASSPNALMILEAGSYTANVASVYTDNGSATWVFSDTVSFTVGYYIYCAHKIKPTKVSKTTDFRRVA